MKISSRTKKSPPAAAAAAAAAAQLPPARSYGLFWVRVFLLLGVIAVLASFAISLQDDQDTEDLLAFFNSPTSPAAPNLVNLRITGQDNESRPYILTATSVRPKSDSTFRGLMMQTGKLTEVEANLEMNDEHWFSLRSPSGEFNTSSNRLLVGPGFDLYTSTGYQMHGVSAAIDLKTSNVIVQGLVEGWGPFGEITAAALDSKDHGAYIRFYGGVNVVLRIPKKKKDQ